MIDLNSSKHKRIFCFGCSFTNHHHHLDAPTWSDILKLHFENTDTEVYNFGRAGAGNYYIFNTIVETSLQYNFTKDDLILIQWSGVLREDRFKDGEWYCNGTVTHGSPYSKEVIRDWFLDIEGMIKRDYSYIHAMQKMLKAGNIDYEMCSMNGVSRYDPANIDVKNRECEAINSLIVLYKDTLDELHPSMFKIIWGSETTHPPKRQIKTRISKENPGGYDQHPLPTEYLLYLEKVFKFKPSDELRTHVDKITKELLV
jgi:hypothetical protein